MQLRPLPVEYGVELQLPAMVGIAIVRLRDAFSEYMEALKHNFLFHGYFKKQGCKKHKENKQGIAAQKSM